MRFFMIIDTHAHTFPDKIAERAIQRLEKISGIKAATNGTLLLSKKLVTWRKRNG